MSTISRCLKCEWAIVDPSTDYCERCTIVRRLAGSEEAEREVARLKSESASLNSYADALEKVLDKRQRVRALIEKAASHLEAIHIDSQYDYDQQRIVREAIQDALEIL